MKEEAILLLKMKKTERATQQISLGMTELDEKMKEE